MKLDKMSFCSLEDKVPSGGIFSTQFRGKTKDNFKESDDEFYGHEFFASMKSAVILFTINWL